MMETTKEKPKVKSLVGKTIDETKFEYPDDLDGLRNEIIKNLNACQTILDINTVLEEYYGEIVARMATGEI